MYNRAIFVDKEASNPLFNKPKKGSEVEIYYKCKCDCGCGQNEYVIIGFEYAKNGKTQRFLENNFVDIITNKISEELAEKALQLTKETLDVPVKEEELTEELT